MGLATPSEAVEEIKNGTEYNKEECHRQCAAHGIVDGNAAADEIAAGDGVGDMLFHNERDLQKSKEMCASLRGWAYIEECWRVVEWGRAM